MKVKTRNIYRNKYKEYYTPAMSGDFGIVDMWPCDKNGYVKTIKRDPSPIPVCTSGLKYVGKSLYSYSYPEGGVLWK